MQQLDVNMLNIAFICEVWTFLIYCKNSDIKNVKIPVNIKELYFKI